MVNNKMGILINSLESYMGRTKSKIDFLGGIRRVKKANGEAFDNFADNFTLGANGKLVTNVEVFLEDTGAKAVPMVLRFDGLGEMPSSEYNKKMADAFELRLNNELEATKIDRDRAEKAVVGLIKNREELVKFFESIWDKKKLTKKETELATQYAENYLVTLDVLKNIK